MSKTTTLHGHHAFLYISLPSLHDYDVKWPNFKFTWELERQGDKFYHLCPNLSAFPSLQLQPKSPFFNTFLSGLVFGFHQWSGTSFPGSLLPAVTAALRRVGRREPWERGWSTKGINDFAVITSCVTKLKEVLFCACFLFSLYTRLEI